MRARLAALWLPVMAAALTGCGGTVAEGGGASTSSAPPAATSAPAGCTEGADSTVHDRGQPDNFNAAPPAPFTTKADGLQLSDFAAGNGPAVAEGQCITVQYTGWLANGTKFDSSRDRDGGFQLLAGRQGQVIPGWQEGIPGMKAGGKRRLVIPPALAYGAQGQPPTIPANSTLTFDIEVIRIH
ncbi:MAG TPA: FKBP-type peptidyl-prolyl cis-trans isomerase [Candidatus Dormibacteraeota bacterium]|nr:FKBP-type peptidyl-prolyl cis-trans isomerase [Candidatus Dormibacteraeota bacterium]